MPLAVAFGIAGTNVGAASAAPAVPGFMMSTVGSAIKVSVVRDNPKGGVNPKCAPVVQEIRLDDQPGFRWAPPTAVEAIAAGAVPSASAASAVVVPYDGVYAVGAICRDAGGESFAPPLAVTIGGPPPSGPEIQAESWQKPIPVPGGPEKAVAVTVKNTGSPGPCGVAVKQVSYLGQPYQFRSSTPGEFAAPGESRIVSAVIPGGGTFMVVGTCADSQTYPPVFVNVP